MTPLCARAACTLTAPMCCTSPRAISRPFEFFRHACECHLAHGNPWLTHHVGRRQSLPRKAARCAVLFERVGDPASAARYGHDAFASTVDHVCAARERREREVDVGPWQLTAAHDFEHLKRSLQATAGSELGRERRHTTCLTMRDVRDGFQPRRAPTTAGSTPRSRRYAPLAHETATRVKLTYPL